MKLNKMNRKQLEAELRKARRNGDTGRRYQQIMARLRVLKDKEKGK